MTTALAAIPNAVDLAYRFWLWIGDRAEVFPRGGRHGTVARGRSRGLSLLSGLPSDSRGEEKSGQQVGGSGHANIVRGSTGGGSPTRRDRQRRDTNAPHADQG